MSKKKHPLENATRAEMQNAEKANGGPMSNTAEINGFLGLRILSELRELVREQKETNTRLKRIEENLEG